LGGSLNLNLLVNRGGECLVVRVHRASVSPARLADIQAVRDRLVEVERFISHDGRMNTWPRLARGLPILGRIHTLLAGAEVSPAGRSVEFANHIEAGQVLAGTKAGTARIRSWHPTPWERRRASEAERLAELVAAGEADLAGQLPRQLVHGDFWDNNVFSCGEDPVFVADFSFMAERARVDDLALTLYYADTELGLTGRRDRVAVLRPLVSAYAGGLDHPLTAAEREALPWVIARQPPWASAAGWPCSMTRAAPGRMPAPPSPPSGAPWTWSPTSAPGRPG
jgi:homoserine kinase type II